jgi:hypothetical protein
MHPLQERHCQDKRIIDETSLRIPDPNVANCNV